MNFIETIKERARQEIKTIVLPEAEDIRTLKATEIALKEKYANIILVGNEKEIKEKAEENTVSDIKTESVKEETVTVEPVITPVQEGIVAVNDDTVNERDSEPKAIEETPAPKEPEQAPEGEAKPKTVRRRKKVKEEAPQEV